jgi:mannose-6-phosphate isomerase
MVSSEVDGTVPTVLALGGRTVTADWGSRTLLAELFGRMPSGRPEAEVWYGAHERHPSPIEWRGAVRSVRDVEGIEAPSFLLKLIAVAAPLSVQVHPDDASAAAGFADEEERGVPRDARERRFGDASGKPELLLAIRPMRVLCGLRSALASRELLSALAPRGFEEPLSLLAHGDARLGDVVALLLRATDLQVAAWSDALSTGATAVLRTAEDQPGDGDEELVRLARLFVALDDRHPGDRGVLVALLLVDRDLSPGQAVYVAPGVPHAYLSGLGVEVMTSSDNVLRGGMTGKPVDVEAFLSVLDASSGGGIRVGALSHRVGDESGWRRFLTPSDAFVLDQAGVRGVLRVERTGAGPAVLLCLEGAVTVRAGDGSGADLAPGDAVLLRRGLDPVEVRGEGDVVHVRAGRRPARPVSPGATVPPSV